MRGDPIQLTALRFTNNKKLVLFNSKFFQPGMSGANAFSQDWAFVNN